MTWWEFFNVSVNADETEVKEVYFQMLRDCTTAEELEQIKYYYAESRQNFQGKKIQQDNAPFPNMSHTRVQFKQIEIQRDETLFLSSGVYENIQSHLSDEIRAYKNGGGSIDKIEEDIMKLLQTENFGDYREKFIYFLSDVGPKKIIKKMLQLPIWSEYERTFFKNSRHIKYISPELAVKWSTLFIIEGILLFCFFCFIIYASLM